MPTLTLELPDDIYRAARLLSPEERVRRFSKAVTEPEEDEEDEYDPTVDPVLSEEDYESIRIGLEQMDRGEGTPGHIVFARLWEKHGFNPKRNPFSKEYEPHP